MDQLEEIINGLAQVGRMLDKEIPQLNKKLDDSLIRTRKEIERDDLQGTLTINKMIDEMKSLKNEVRALKPRMAALERFHNYIDSSEDLVDDIEEQVKDVVEYLQQYGYKPPKRDEDKTDGSEDDKSIDSSDQKELPSDLSTPLKDKTPVTENKTPDLADFGLSHLKDARYLSMLKEKHPVTNRSTSQNISGLNTPPRNNSKIIAEATPLEFSNDGIIFSPGVFSKSSSSAMDTPFDMRSACVLDADPDDDTITMLQKEKLMSQRNAFQRYKRPDNHLKSISNKNLSKCVERNLPMPMSKDQNEIGHDNTPEEPSFKSNFSYQLKDNPAMFPENYKCSNRYGFETSEAVNTPPEPVLKSVTSFYSNRPDTNSSKTAFSSQVQKTPDEPVLISQSNIKNSTEIYNEAPATPKLKCGYLLKSLP